jgi:predicted DNA-binding transcriptional regulator AlpA
MIDTVHPEEALLVGANRAAGLCGVCRRTWAKMDATGQCPPPRRLGRRVLWSVKELTAWIDAGCPERDAWRPERC